MKVDRIRSGVASRRLAFGAIAYAVVLLVPVLIFAEDAPEEPASWDLRHADLYDVHVRGAQAWAVGYWGTILHSADAGRSWSRRPTPTHEALYAVSFADERHGWAVGAGGVVLRSVDGGRSWRHAAVPSSTEAAPGRGASLLGVVALSAAEAWAVGELGTVLRTRDGARWERVEIAEEAFGDELPPDRIFSAVVFSDRDHGWIAGEFGTVLRTRDGGRSWAGAARFVGADPETTLLDLAVDDGALALAVGVGGVVLRSEDGGRSWSAAELPARGGLFGAALRGGRALVVGGRGAIHVSRDGGARWLEPERPPHFRWLRAAAFGADGQGLAVGERGLILHSPDGRASWQPSEVTWSR